MKYFVCEDCDVEIPGGKPEYCLLCGSKKFVEIDKQVIISSEEKKYSKKYDEVLKHLEKYDEGTEPEDMKYSFAD